MRFLAGLVTFFILLALNTPFAVALFLGIAAGVILHFAKRPDADDDEPHSAARPPAQAAPGSHDVPDGSDPAALRTYLIGLTLRLRTLEKEVRALRGAETPEGGRDPAAHETAQAAPAYVAESMQAAAVQPKAAVKTEVPADSKQVPPPAPSAATRAVGVTPPLTPHPVAGNGLELNVPAAPLTRHARAETTGVHGAAEQRGPASAGPPKLAPSPEPGPSLISRLLSGNIVAKVGAIILFFGVGFLLKFAYERNMVSPEARLVGVALAAVAVFVTGWKLTAHRRLYAVILQGVASGLAYLDVFFALKTYSFISAPLGFALFAALGVLTTLFAVRQDAKPLAVLGLTGAFMAPVLASSGSGNVQFLFTYYLLLNLFILAVSWFRSWRVLNLTGWFFTFAVAVIWGARNYRPELFSTVEPFLIAFFTIYLVIPILFAMRQPPELKGIVDGTLVFGTPAAAAALQARLVWDIPYGLAWSCALGAALYGVLSLVVFRHRNMKLLGETYVALATGLATLAIFYAFGAYTTFALWTIEGSAILWVCLRQKHRAGRLFAVLVQIAGAAYFFLDYTRYPRFNPYFNDAVLGCAIIAAGSFISAGLYRKYREEITDAENTLATVILVWGALCWSLGGLDVIHYALETMPVKVAAALVFFSASGVIAELWGARTGWNAPRGLTILHSPILFGAALLLFMEGVHPLSGSGWIAWPLAIATLFWVLHRQRRDGCELALEARYASGWLLLAGLATWEALWWMDKREYMSVMIIALLGYVAGGLRFRLRERGTDTPRLSALVLLWSMFFWFAAGLSWIGQHFDANVEVRAALLFATLSAGAYGLLDRLQWPAMGMAARLPWIAIPAALATDYALRSSAYHPFGDAWGLVWPLALMLAAWRLRREEAKELFATPVRHAVLFYTAVALATWELTWQAAHAHFGSAWQLAALSLPASLCVLGLVAARRSKRWPLALHWVLYRDVLLMPLAAALMLFCLIANVRTPGTLEPLGGYVPLLNPIDVAITAAACAVASWNRSAERLESRQTVWTLLAILGFVCVNGIALRTFHYWFGVPYRLNDLMASVMVQATLSILWTLTALALMVLARRRMERAFWIAGAALLALVVGKLFLVDLANTGTVARIVSFLGVGVMLLVIGYVAPVPPGVKEAEGRS